MAKKEEKIIEEPVEEVKKEYTGDLRGFKTLEEAVNYVDTPEFERLDIGCRTEYKNWLKSIKED